MSYVLKSHKESYMKLPYIVCKVRVRMAFCNLAFGGLR